MKVLYVVGTNLSMNTSANISHNAYVQGLIENGCDVDILMSSSSWGEKDESLPIWPDANYYIYNSISTIDHIKSLFKKAFDQRIAFSNTAPVIDESEYEISKSTSTLKQTIRRFLKTSYDFAFNTSQIYNLDRTWLKNASSFKEKSPYDLIISNSSPASSHKLVLDLLRNTHLTDTRWIQIWEDPWFFDLYGGHSVEVKREEHRLLKAAKEIFYVSTLTLYYQKKHFADCAHKMKHIPLPYLKIDDNKSAIKGNKIHFGYFGDYYRKTRNLQPFYEAMVKSQAFGLINGDTDLDLASTNRIKVGGRVNLEELSRLQDETDVLVHLCNLHGGQIPGKIYHYSATEKPILFILDGTIEEKKVIKEYFKTFNRYHFCDNTKEEILKIINKFLSGSENFEESPVLDFAPQQVIKKLLFD